MEAIMVCLFPQTDLVGRRKGIEKKEVKYGR